MLRKLLRIVFTVAGAIVGYGAFLLSEYLVSISKYKELIHLTETQKMVMAVVVALIFGVIFFRLTPTIKRQGNRLANNIEGDLQKVPVNDILLGTVGLILGLIIASLISNIYSMIRIPYLDIILNIVTYIFLGYLGVIIATRKGPDLKTLIATNKRSGSSGGRNKHKGDSTPKILDTSVIIDGRIADIMDTGFLEGTIVIPEFVLVELRHIADSSDTLKRVRGRRGLDILNKIQNENDVEIYNSNGEKALEEIPEVDVKLLKLAQMMKGKVVTNDYNLNKVAGIKGVEVLNINELTNALKPIAIAGEEMMLSLVKEGKERNQAVAYLDDGTMIVVEDGRKHIGETIKVTVTSVLQTSAGRMVFAKPTLKG